MLLVLSKTVIHLSLAVGAVNNSVFLLVTNKGTSEYCVM